MANLKKDEIEISKITTLKTEPLQFERANETSLFKTIKIYERSAETLETLSSIANGSGPKRVQWKDLIDFALSKVTPNDLKKLREEKLTASDRFEEMYQRFLKENPKGSRESFLSHILETIPSDPQNHVESLSESEAFYG